MSIKKESKSILILLVIISVSLTILFFSSKGIDHLSSIKYYIWISYILGYFGLLLLFNWLYEKTQNIVVKYLNYLISIPLHLILFLLQIAVPTMGLIFHFIFYILLCFIVPIILISLNEYFAYYELSDQTKIFISLTFATCVSVTFYKQILYVVYRFGPFRIKSSKFKKFKLDELTDYVLNKENIRFVIYSSFFIYLLVFSFQYLQKSSIFEIAEKDRAVYQSFLCFLAFDRLLLNSNKFKLIPSALLGKMLSSFDRDEKNKI